MENQKSLERIALETWDILEQMIILNHETKKFNKEMAAANQELKSMVGENNE